MQSPVKVHKTVRGNRLKIAIFSLGFFIIIVAGLYYFLSFKKSHITPTLEGTWICQQYLDSIAAKRSIAAIKSSPLFLQISFKKGWVDSVMGTGTTNYRMTLLKQKKGKYLLTRYNDTVGVVNLKKEFLFEEVWSGVTWLYTKADTAFKSFDGGKVFRKELNKILISGRYKTLFGKSLSEQVVFTDSGTVSGIKNIISYKLCILSDCLRSAFPKDALFLSDGKISAQYAFDWKSDTLNIYTINHTNGVNNFKLYWSLLRLSDSH